eukprot:TRINITY_DN24749_c0_g4_i1.p1 TRINITY_DN24749_c0_g4~~TRINITY_DN24749_c0_g4_i1.p1  ORF type:complete len:339 (-),score=45.17 TRINITY_DN24749_c0_g4_i1:501-1517(-)
MPTSLTLGKAALRARAQRRRSRSTAASAAATGNGSIPTRDFTANGKTVKVMQGDYGFRSGAGRLYEDQYGEVPANILSLATNNFKDEWLNMRRMFVKDEFKDIGENKDQSNIFNKATVWVGAKTVAAFRSADDALVRGNVLRSIDEFEVEGFESSKDVREELKKLTLNAKAVLDREKERFKESPPTAPFFIKWPYHILCWVLDVVYEGRPIQRFWVLEEVARMPYFAYISMLHLYESLGWWRAGAALRKVHFAEENEELLKSLPPPAVAVEYYLGKDVYMFTSMHISSPQCTRNPKCENLYDVFINIRDDEIEHRKTMVACQDPEAVAKEISDAAKLR